MPEKGYSSVTLPDRVYERLQKCAEDTVRTVPKLIEWMLDQCFPEKPKQEA